MAEPSIADLVAHVGLNVDKGSFDEFRQTIDKIRNVEMQGFIDKANEMAKAVKGVVPTTHKANEAVDWLGRGLKAIIGYEVGSHLLEMGKSAMEAGANMGDLADKTGSSLEEIQELGYAAKIHGHSVESMAGLLSRLSMTIDKAATKGGEMAAPFQKAGIAIKDASGKARPAMDVFGDIADHIQSLDEELRPAAIQKFGKQFKEFIPMMKDGSAGLTKLRMEAHQFGQVLSKDTVDAMDRVGKNSKRLGAAWEGIKTTAISALIPAIEELTNTLIAWYKANKEDIAAAVAGVFSLVLTVVQLLAKALMVLVKVGATVAKNWKLVLILLGSLATAYGIVKVQALLAGDAAMLAGIETAKAWLIALAPILLIAAGVAALIFIIEDLYVWLKGGKSLMGKLFGKADDNVLVSGIKKVFNFIVESVKWIIGLVGDVIDQAIAAYQWITGKDTLNDAVTDQMKKNGASEDDITIAKTASALGLDQNGDAYNKAYQTTQFAPIQYPQEASQFGPSTVTVNNEININGGDPAKTREIVTEELDKNHRKIAATVGGAKKK